MEQLLSSWGMTQPQIQAAVIQGLLSLIGIVVTGVFAVLSWRRTQNAERERQVQLRAEKIADYCAALRAEIASELTNLTAFDLDAHFAEIESRYAADPNYSVIVPHLARNLVFSSITGELHILRTRLSRRLSTMSASARRRPVSSMTFGTLALRSCPDQGSWRCIEVIWRCVPSSRCWRERRPRRWTRSAMISNPAWVPTFPALGRWSASATCGVSSLPTNIARLRPQFNEAT